MTPLAPLSASSKITPAHLQRLAFIYVRQSSPKQVAQNKESQQYQYQLRQRAIELGWAAERVRVIDSDLGRSGSEADRISTISWSKRAGPESEHLARAGARLSTTDRPRLSSQETGTRAAARADKKGMPQK